MEYHPFAVGASVMTREAEIGVDRKSLPRAGYVTFRLVVVDEKGRESAPVEMHVSLLDRDGSTPF